MLAKLIRNRAFRWVAPAALALVSAVVAAGCQDNAQASSAPITKRGGAQLWADNCMRCHNLRPPTQYSNAQWQIFVHHMRIRADLTGEEEREILAFIQSANAH